MQEESKNGGNELAANIRHNKVTIEQIGKYKKRTHVESICQSLDAHVLYKSQIAIFPIIKMPYVVIYKKTRGSLCGCAFAVPLMSISAVYLIGWMARNVGVTIGL